ncbi:DUF1997 domain-containing protein [Synechocystis salina]|nr:DUF1997 domain-containing protein [Synechocystis salina]
MTHNSQPLPVDPQDNGFPPVRFQTHFQGRMEMFASGQEVEDYLQAHQGWFRRCAQPMQADPLGDHGYVLTIGKFGALGFDVEPKIAVMLEPPQDGNYLMHTVPLPDGPDLGYEVDFLSNMTLHQVNGDRLTEKSLKQFAQAEIPWPETITQVEWDLKMDVAVQFPGYIYKLPMKLIQSTGDRLLTEIIRQVSPRLTYKVQQDFHQEKSLPLPPKSGRYFQRVKRAGEDQLEPDLETEVES